MMIAKKYRVFLLVFALVGMQTLLSVHSIDHVIEHHDHGCSLCLAGHGNHHASLVSYSVSFLIFADYFSDFFVGTFYTPAFSANFFGRAPPLVSPT